MHKALGAALAIVIAASTPQGGSAQEKDAEQAYSKETLSTKDNSVKTGQITKSDTSRQNILNWNPITVPSGNGFQFSQRVSNLAVSIIEQKKWRDRENNNAICSVWHLIQRQ